MHIFYDRLTTSGSSSSTSNGFPSFFNCFLFSFTCCWMVTFYFLPTKYPSGELSNMDTKCLKWMKSKEMCLTLTMCSTYSFPAWITSKALFFCSGSNRSLYALSTATTQWDVQVKLNLCYLQRAYTKTEAGRNISMSVNMIRINLWV